MLIDDFRSEYARWRTTAEQAIAQMSDDALNHVPSPEGNSVAMLVRHVSGNLVSRFTNFLSEDGEKPDRDRDGEFELTPDDTRDALMERWAEGWRLLITALDSLQPEDLTRTLQIRREPHSVLGALNRNFGHLAYHVGQIVLLAKHWVGSDWHTLTIPWGQSQAFTQSKQEQSSARARS